MGLYTPDCQGTASYIHAHFGLESWKKFKSKATPSGKYYFIGEQDEYLVDAILRGQFEKMKDADCDERESIYCYEFIVLDIEQVKATDVKLHE